MNLRETIDQYILWRRAHGAKFTGSATLLRRFLQHANGDAACDAVEMVQVLSFVAGQGPLTRYRQNKHGALASFWRYAISRGHATRSPLPLSEPKPPPRTPPYIYSRSELQRLFDPANAAICRCSETHLDAVTFRTLIILLYAAGLRYCEATKLTLADVDMAEAVLTVRDTKFYKTRLVPMGPQLVTVLGGYITFRRRHSFAEGSSALLLSNRNGSPLASTTVQKAFDTLRRVAGVHNVSGPRQVPRLHDLRHSFAVHNLTAWYREGADVQRLLPALSIYLGHSDLEGTKVYLSMTPELLQQAALRFARFAGGGAHA